MTKMRQRGRTFRGEGLSTRLEVDRIRRCRRRSTRPIGATGNSAVWVGCGADLSAFPSMMRSVADFPSARCLPFIL